MVVEDHHLQGGLGAAVLEAPADQEQPPGSPTSRCAPYPVQAPPHEVMDAAGTTAPHITTAARPLLT
ncbi:hypothetical protein ACR6C2_41595 [Streptomyces sp. INA 01156]